MDYPHHGYSLGESPHCFIFRSPRISSILEVVQDFLWLDAGHPNSFQLGWREMWPRGGGEQRMLGFTLPAV